MDQIFLLAPTSTPARIQFVANQASGFIYYVSLKGVTGAATLDVAEAATRIQQIKAVTNVPVGVGLALVMLPLPKLWARLPTQSLSEVLL